MTNIRLTDIIGPAFYGVHNDIKAGRHTHYTLKGGRGALKSSFVSVEGILLLKKNPDVHMVVFRKVAATLRDSVYAQYVWAITVLGVTHEFDCRVSPMEIVYKPTGQKILFRGLDDWAKVKSIKVPFGYIGITHFEELDQFAGREEVRGVLQSTMRGGERFWNFETYNPPKTQANWVNTDAMKVRPGRLVHHSSYLQAPRAWLGEKFIDEAEELKRLNETAYRHEYGGEVTGTGGSVFENVKAREVTDFEIAQFERCYHGVDWGYYPDPWAYIRCNYNPATRRLIIFQEACEYKMKNRATADILLASGAPKCDGSDEIIICDSAEPKSIADYADYGLRVIGAEKGPNSVAYSHKWLQSLTEIVIDPARCPGAFKEFMEYEYQRTRTGEVISGYPDKNNHRIDATRYALNLQWRSAGK